MSCAETAPELQKEEANGKPCIDFKPDERWGIQDDDKKKVSNGRRSKRLRSKSNHTGMANGGDDSSSEEEDKPSTNTIEAIIHTEEQNKCDKPRPRLTRGKRCNSELNNGKVAESVSKKMKADLEEIETINDVEMSDGDSQEMPQLTAEVPEKDESSSSNQEASNGADRTIPEMSEISSSSNEATSKNAVSEVSEESGDSNKSEKDIEVINLQDDEKEESDSEIQILNDEEKAETTDVAEFPTSDPNLTSEENIRVSAGYPYYNSLKEKIPSFKAGDYKPVKFPHQGTLLLGENEVIIESPSLLVPLLIKETDTFPKLEGADPKPKITAKKTFFQSSVGQFLINLGSSRVQEWYHRDMKRAKLKQFKAKKNPDEELKKAVAFHEQKHDQLVKSNLAFNPRMRQCKQCGFKTESLHVMEGHLVIPHMTTRREYKCNFCTFITRAAEQIIFHYQTVHKKKAFLDNYMQLHECIYCSFVHTLKNKVTMHMTRCRKHFLQSQNLAPPFEFEFPGVTTKPVTISDAIGHRRLMLNAAAAKRPDEARRKLASVLTNLSSQFGGNKNGATLVKQLVAGQQSGGSIQLPPGIVLTRPRSVTQLRPIATRFPQPRMAGTNLRPGMTFANTATASQLASAGISITPVQSTPRTAPLSGVRNITLTPIAPAGSKPQPVALFSSGSLVGQPQARFPMIRPTTTRSPTPYQRLTTPPSQVVKGSSGNTFVVCEICDSYIKDLEELRTHMNFVHKVKIHPKMLVSRPPLNCQKCQWRFFTDQGLERHLLGAHGLVTTNMQEMANQNKDGGRCIICGAVFTYKLVSHMTQVHKVTLKPAHLSYKCTVCTATFNLYRLFESHVYNVHSGSSKKAAAAANAQAPATEAPKAAPVVPKGPTKCKDCKMIVSDMSEHLVQKHLKDLRIKLCRIQHCKKCLYSSDEMLVIRMSDFGIAEPSSSSDSSSSDDDDSD